VTRGRGRARTGAAGGLPPIYEGPEALSALLARAGSPFNAEEVSGRFSAALAAGESRADVIPSLFEEEPRFASPADARRLYGNLFGLWARLASGLSAEDDAPAPVPAADAPAEEALEPLPPRGLVPGDELPAEVIEATWKWLDAAPTREAQRWRDRFANSQPDLAAWLDAVPLPERGSLAATDLCFEAWAMFDQAFGARLGAVGWSALRDLESEPPPVESVQPALAAYAAEQLDLLAGEDEDFTAADRAQLERVLATVAAALTRSLRSLRRS
jgi:hypothetical protein